MGVHIRCPCRSGRRECDAPSDRCTDKAELGVARSMHWLDAASIWRSNLSLDLRRPLRYAKRNHSTFGCCETKRIGSRQKYRLGVCSVFSNGGGQLAPSFRDDRLSLGKWKHGFATGRVSHQLGSQLLEIGAARDNLSHALAWECSASSVDDAVGSVLHPAVWAAC